MKHTKNTIVRISYIASIILLSTITIYIVLIFINSITPQLIIDVRLQQEKNTMPSGTLAQAGEKTAPVFAMGFTEGYNSYIQHQGNYLNIFLRDGNDAYKIESIGKPFPQSGAYLSRSGNVLYAFPVNAIDKIVYAFDPDKKEWTALKQDNARTSRKSKRDVLDFAPIRQCSAPKGMVGNYVLYRFCLIASGNVLFERTDRKFIHGIFQNALIPIYIANREITFWYSDAAHAKASGLLFCPRKEDAIDFDSCVRHDFETFGEFPYASFSGSGKKIVVTTNIGNIIEFNPDTSNIVYTRRSDGTSFQVYSAISYFNNTLLGTYPAGKLLTYEEGKLTSFTPELPVQKYSKSLPELQSLSLYKGKLFAGVWPWGMVYAYAPGTDRWRIFHRFFSSPEMSDGELTQEPYYNKRNTNELGQRILDLLPLGDSLYVATSSKSSKHLDNEKYDVAPESLTQYGQIYRIGSSGALSVDIGYIEPETTAHIRIIVRGKRMRVYRDGHALASTNIARGNFSCQGKMEKYNGIFGALKNVRADITIKRNQFQCGLSSILGKVFLSN
jgi:hypothetical protein